MKKVYFNPVQLQCQWIAANTTVMVCGRRTGKTDGMAAPFLLRCVQRMPGCTGGIVCPTYLHALTNTVPGVLAALRRWGYVDGIHFVVGRKPPRHFAHPIIKPADYTHVITFYNGTTVIIISQDRQYAANSLTLSFLLIDEAKFIDFARLKDQTLPANGGNRHFFAGCSSQNAMMVLSDMPQTKKGSWFLNYRDKMDPRVIDAIKDRVHESWRLRSRIRDLAAAGSDTSSYIRRLKAADRQLNQLRASAVYYRECSSVENIELIGEKYIRQMRRDLTPLTFRTSIMCERLGVAHDGFYNNFTDAHRYDASDLAYLDAEWNRAVVNGQPSRGTDARADADVDPDQPICIGMDYNANINWIVAAQPHGRRLDVIKSFYVKYTRKIPELIADFTHYYASHRARRVIFYYDSTALGQNYFVNDRDIRATVITEFQRHGWSVDDIYIGQPMRHDEKYRLINQGFSGYNNLTPMFNRQNNDDLILALECAGVERGRLGFRKNKAGEKLPENEENLLEHRTDGTDAFDTLYIGAERFPRSASLAFSMHTDIL